ARHARRGNRPEQPRQPAGLDQEPRLSQARVAHAGHRLRRCRARRGHRLPDDASLKRGTNPMTTESMVFTAEAPDRTWLERAHGWVTTVDHKRLGIMYIVLALIFLVVGGLEATVIRLQLMKAHANVVPPEIFNELFTMHGTTMIFFVAMPIMFGSANYLAPLMIGARDMAFPRLNAFTFWLTAFSGVLLYYSLLGGYGLYGDAFAPNVGWFAYAPLKAQTCSRGHRNGHWE